MFDIGWSELVVIGVVALIAIGPKELPGVLRMVGQWIGKARRMAADFQGQFNEAMREAEMADIKKSFDDVSAAAKDLHPTNLLSSLNKEVEDAVRLDPPKIDPPVMTSTTEPVTQSSFTEGEAHALMVEKSGEAPEPELLNTVAPEPPPGAKAS